MSNPRSPISALSFALAFARKFCDSLSALRSTRRLLYAHDSFRRTESKPLVDRPGPARGSALAIADLRAVDASLSSRCRRKRLIDNLPTSKTQGVFVGLVEVKGTAQVRSATAKAISPPLPCVYYSYTRGGEAGRGRRRCRRSAMAAAAPARRNANRDRLDHRSIPARKGRHSTCRTTPAACGCSRRARRSRRSAFSTRSCMPMDPLYYGKGPALADRRTRIISGASPKRRFPLQAPIFLVGPGARTAGRCRAGNRGGPERGGVSHFRALAGGGQQRAGLVDLGLLFVLGVRRGTGRACAQLFRMSGNEVLSAGLRDVRRASLSCLHRARG